jgi:phage protein D
LHFIFSFTDEPTAREISIMIKPAYKLTIGTQAVDSTIEPKAGTLVDLNVSLDMDTPADSFCLVLGNLEGIKPSVGDEAAIELGYSDGLVQVIRGKVVSVEFGLTSTRVIGLSPASNLLRYFYDHTYQDKKAGEIVSDLAGQAGVAVASAQSGTAFPAYVIDGRQSAYRHMRDLADLSGFDLCINWEGKLVFEAYAGGKAVHVLESGKHILELEMHHSQPRSRSVEAWGESPGGGRSALAWSWLTKDFHSSKGSAGEGTPKLLVERSSLRTAEAAQAAAEAMHTNVQRQAVRGRLLVQGSARIRLGDAVRLAGVGEDLNKTYQVRTVTHRLTKSSGFTTAVGFRSVEA